MFPTASFNFPSFQVSEVQQRGCVGEASPQVLFEHLGELGGRKAWHLACPDQEHLPRCLSSSEFGHRFHVT